MRLTNLGTRGTRGSPEHALVSALTLLSAKSSGVRVPRSLLFFRYFTLLYFRSIGRFDTLLDRSTLY